MAICTSFLTRNLFQASEKVRQCYCCLEKVVQRHEAQLDIVGRYTGCFLFPPPSKLLSKKVGSFSNTSGMNVQNVKPYHKKYPK